MLSDGAACCGVGSAGSHYESAALEAAARRAPEIQLGRIALAVGILNGDWPEEDQLKKFLLSASHPDLLLNLIQQSRVVFEPSLVVSCISSLMWIARLAERFQHDDGA